MTLKAFLNLYDNWYNIIVQVNDNNLQPIVKGNPFEVLSHEDVGNKEVVVFGVYDNELYVRVK